MKLSNEDRRRFWKKVFVLPDNPELCWEWKESTRLGYGRFRIGEKKYSSHRIAYELKIGTIPLDMDVCHTCDNPSCCNPSHLFIGTAKDNMNDMHSKGRGNPKPRPGEMNAMSKLNEDQVRFIKASNLKQIDLAKMFSVCKQTISEIKNNKTWSHLV